MKQMELDILKKIEYKIPWEVIRCQVALRRQNKIHFWSLSSDISHLVMS